jgi:hypothetical protein
MNLARTPHWLGHGDVVLMAARHGDVVRLDLPPWSAGSALEPDVRQAALRGLRFVLAGFGALCVPALCTLCEGIFNPLGGPCGAVICPHCLRRYVPSVKCAPCGAATRAICPIRRTRHEDRQAAEARAV